MRAFTNKWFHRWARAEGILDDTLLEVAIEIVEGKVEANLGSYLFKKRVARAGSGKSGGYRIIVGYKPQHAARVIFLYAFAKKDRADITTNEEAALSLAAGAFLSASDQQVDLLIAQGSVWEIKNNERDPRHRK